MIDPQRLATINDPGVPALIPLLGAQAVDILDAALSSAGGATEEVHATQVRYLPSRSVMVQYSAEVSWKPGRSGNETMVAASGLRVPDGPALVEADGIAVSVWRYPDDPFLPGLPASTDPARVGRFMEQLGVHADAVQLKRRAYRPGRRAVIEATTAGVRAFLKVVRPKKVASLQAVHAAMVGHVPIPQSLGWSEELGLVAMQSMPGRTLRRSLDLGAPDLPRPGALLELLDALPHAEATSHTVPDRRSRIRRHTHLLRTVLPELTDRLDAAVESMESARAADLVPVHGDFHASQILTRGETIVGLVDVDTAGMGQRVDDLGTLLAQIATVALNSPNRAAIAEYGSQLIREFDRTVDPVTLRLATATSVFGFATGPFRVLQSDWVRETERRISLCEQWIDSARLFTG